MTDLPDVLPDVSRRVPAGTVGDLLGGVASRRSLLAVGLGGVGLLAAGCSSGTGSDRADPTPAAPASTTPDVAVATLALTEIRSTLAAVRATGARFPATRPALAALVTMHEAHERSLVDAVPVRGRTTPTPAPYAVPRRREAAVRRLTATEQGLHDTLDRLALRAQSGQFARLLASMGTAVTLRLTGLAS